MADHPTPDIAGDREKARKPLYQQIRFTTGHNNQQQQQQQQQQDIVCSSGAKSDTSLVSGSSSKHIPVFGTKGVSEILTGVTHHGLESLSKVMGLETGPAGRIAVSTNTSSTTDIYHSPQSNRRFPGGQGSIQAALVKHSFIPEIDDEQQHPWSPMTDITFEVDDN